MAGMTLASCNYTDLSPQDSFTDKSYWNSANDLKMYANGLYNNMLAGPSAGYDGTSDNFINRVYSGYLYNEYTVPTSGGSWDWGSVRNCNYFMQRYQKVSGSEAEINKYVAEVRFFRAQEYYGKIKTFGDVPWYETDLQTGDEAELFKGRDPRNFVLKKVIEDLEFAIQWLPEKTMAEKGRLHKDAARTQLARVCLYYGTYMKYHHEAGSEGLTAEGLLTKAKQLTDEIINSGKYEIVKGSDAGAGTKAYEGYPLDYANLFVQEDLSDCKEAILARFYETGVLTHETGRQAGESGMGLTKDFIESFLMKVHLSIMRVQAIWVIMSWRMRLLTATHVSISSSTTSTSHTGSVTAYRHRILCQTVLHQVVFQVIHVPSSTLLTRLSIRLATLLTTGSSTVMQRYCSSMPRLMLSWVLALRQFSTRPSTSSVTV